MNARRVPELDAQQQLLDRQIRDKDGFLVGKVDDVELAELPDGRLAVTALLTGPGALGPRIGGTVGALSTRVWTRLTGKPPGSTNRIEITDVADLGTVVTLAIGRETAGVDGFEVWARTRVIDAIPGSGKDPE
jgi:hypothetical protein